MSGVDVPVDGPDELPDRGQAALERVLAHRLVQPLSRLGRRPLHGLLVAGRRAGRAGRRHVVGDQRRRPRDQIAEVVGEIGVQPGDERVLREVGVEPERHLAQDEIAKRVVADGAVLGGEGQRLDDVAERLGHLVALDRPVGVDVEVPVEREAGRLQHAGPVHRVRLEVSLPIRCWATGQNFSKRGSPGPPSAET